MKKLFYLLFASGLITIAVTSCENESPKPTDSASEKIDSTASARAQIEWQNWQVQAVDIHTPIPADKKSSIVGGKKDLMDENTMGFKVGDDFPEVILYRENGEPFNVLTELEDNRAIMLVSGSYSCPIFRRKIPFIDSIRESYSDEIDIYVVYTTEAHPDDVASPYRDSVWLTHANESNTVLVNQAKNFGERVETAKQMAADLGLEGELLFDGPDDLFWYQMGQAPVFVYLITPDKKIAAYQKLLRNGELTKCLSDVHTKL